MLPRLELTENPNQKNDFIIFRKQIEGKKVPSLPKVASRKLSSKKTRKHKKGKTRKHKRSKSIFDLF
jgi:hypothetical protein